MLHLRRRDKNNVGKKRGEMGRSLSDYRQDADNVAVGGIVNLLTPLVLERA